MTDILAYTFFQNALTGSLLASILCGLVGTYIVTRRLVFISGGVSACRLCCRLPCSPCFPPAASNGRATGKASAKTLPSPSFGHWA